MLERLKSTKIISIQDYDKINAIDQEGMAGVWDDSPVNDYDRNYRPQLSKLLGIELILVRPTSCCQRWRRSPMQMPNDWPICGFARLRRSRRSSARHRQTGSSVFRFQATAQEVRCRRDHLRQRYADVAATEGESLDTAGHLGIEQGEHPVLLPEPRGLSGYPDDRQHADRWPPGICGRRVERLVLYTHRGPPAERDCDRALWCASRRCRTDGFPT